MDKVGDEVNVRRLSKDEKEYISGLFERYYSSLVGKTFKYYRNIDYASVEDIVSDAFAGYIKSYLKKKEKDEEIEKPEDFLNRIIKNKVNDVFKEKNKHRIVFFSDFPNVEQLADLTSQDLGEKEEKLILFRLELVDIVKELINEAKGKTKILNQLNCFYKKYIQLKDVYEIGQDSHLNESTVKSYLSEARKLIREQYKARAKKFNNN